MAAAQLSMPTLLMWVVTLFLHFTQSLIIISQIRGGLQSEYMVNVLAQALAKSEAGKSPVPGILGGAGLAIVRNELENTLARGAFGKEGFPTGIPWGAITEAAIAVRDIYPQSACYADRRPRSTLSLSYGRRVRIRCVR
jgi:hypothetical protein